MENIQIDVSISLCINKDIVIWQTKIDGIRQIENIEIIHVTIFIRKIDSTRQIEKYRRKI